MSTPLQGPVPATSMRRKSDVTVPKKKEPGKLRSKVTQIPQSVVKGGLTLLDTINDTINESNQTQDQKNVLQLVETLMREIQALKNFLKDERLNNILLADYITKQESVHRSEIKKIVDDLENERVKRGELENLFKELVTEISGKPIFSNLSIRSKIEQSYIGPSEPHEQYKLTEEFVNFPNFSDFKELEKTKLDNSTTVDIETESTEHSEPSQETGEPEAEPEKPELQLKDISTMVLVEPRVSGFKIENGFVTYGDVSETPTTESAPIIEPEKDIPYYQIYFHAKPHQNLIVEDPVKGIIVISIATGEEHEIFKQYGAIIRMDSGTTVLPLKSRQRKKKILQHLQLSANAIIKDIRDPAFQDSLKVMEQKEMQIRAKYKFAVLYAKEGQSEAEMFGNVEASPDFEEFLSFLGERVPLQGWSSYSGGLDTKTNTTGTHSIFCTHKGLEIMFHVSTMIPANEDDEIQVERKRHLGNDVVVIVFKEGNQSFSPKIIRSHFNCVFIVIQKLEVPSFPETTDTFYQLSVCSRDGIPPFPPFIQDPPIFKKNADFRTFLLHKMINGERQASQYAPEFNQRMVRARNSALLTLAKDYLKK